MAQQLSVFLENTPGRLKQLTNSLGEQEINMHALFVADTSDFGVARIICDRTEDAVTVLRDAGFSVTTTEVLAVEIPDRPGSLGELFAAIADAGMDISYTYCLVEPATKKAVNFCRLKSPQVQATEVIEAAGFRVLGDSVFHGV